MYKSTTESVKNIIIVLLFVSAIVLGKNAGIFDEFMNVSGLLGLRSGIQREAEAGAREGAKPTAIMVTFDGGGHFGAKYGSDAYSVIYERSKTVAVQCLQSAGKPYKVSEENWKNALLSESVYFDYPASVSLRIISRWLGAETDMLDNFSTHRICICSSGNANSIYFADEKTNEFYCIDTEIQLGVISQINLDGPGDDVFVFEIEEIKNPVDKYAVVLAGEITCPIITSKNPLEDASSLSGVLRTLGADAYSNYIEEDGTTVFVADTFTLRILPDGTMIYKSVERSGISDSNYSIFDAIQDAESIAWDTVGSLCGDWEISFAGTQEQENIYTVRFYYLVCGCRVLCGESGFAAEISLRDGAIYEMTLCFRNYANSGMEQKLLPERQAAAASGGSFTTCYLDDGSGTVIPEYVKQPEVL